VGPLETLDELANNADNRPLLSVACSELPRLASGLLPAHAPDPPLRVVSTTGNPDTTPRNKQQHTNDEEPERPGQQRRGWSGRS
jgi:hypothetical protein